MAEVTIARLRKFRQKQNMIDDLEQMKLQWYRPVHSPVLNGMPHSTTPSDPTAHALTKIEEANNKIAMIQNELADELSEILDWLYEPDKSEEFQRIIICHYLNRMSWEATTRHVLGYYGTESARNYVYRYFDKVRRNETVE